MNVLYVEEENLLGLHLEQSGLFFIFDRISILFSSRIDKMENYEVFW